MFILRSSIFAVMSIVTMSLSTLWTNACLLIDDLMGPSPFDMQQRPQYHWPTQPTETYAATTPTSPVAREVDRLMINGRLPLHA